jgi:hypothetical protein
LDQDGSLIMNNEKKCKQDTEVILKENLHTKITAQNDHFDTLLLNFQNEITNSDYEDNSKKDIDNSTIPDNLYNENNIIEDELCSIESLNNDQSNHNSISLK